MVGPNWILCVKALGLLPIEALQLVEGIQLFAGHVR